eukprot:TRINITY_DN14070_c0_g1_i1.p1 TRINITY_DN14070_c0_g1~~TRINITY_DN14070_c0_g1_i1.p1  ORF type:complete len:625 (+),score=249.77 TRINITY_DN14070_c0_g1_i1:106-1980(+)
MSLASIEEAMCKSGYADGSVIPDDEVFRLIDQTDEANHNTFFQGGDYDAKALQSFLDTMVLQLNSKECHEHKKTRLLIVLNNVAMRKETRPAIFSAIKTLDFAMETSMKVEGTMPFDSELGRMSEHMLVLLCRVQNFKIKAHQVLEFAEGNVQFAVQLLLAILLKEPPYEFELRVNCMTGLLGFSHPSAFFTAEAADSIQERALEDFEEKVNQICKLSKRLLVMQVVAEAINPHLLQEGPVLPVVHVACQSIMRFVTHIFTYATQQATAFRQHIITSTTFIDQVVVPYVCKLIHQVAQAFEMHDQKMNVTTGFNPLKPPPRAAASVPKEVTQGLTCSLRFLALCTFHMGSYGRTLRFINSFTHDLLRLPLEGFVAKNPAIFGALLQFNCNIDALAGEERLPQAEHLPMECTSEYIAGNISAMLSGLGQRDLTQLQRMFHKTADTLLARDVETFNRIDEMITQAIEQREKQGPVAVEDGAAKASGDFRLLGDLPDPAKSRQVDKVTGADLEEKGAVQTDDALVRPHQLSERDVLSVEGGAPADFRCALNGHLMKCPVKSPYGHHFEKETIEKWLSTAGSTCPFTGKPLTIKDLEDDHELHGTIMAWHIKEQMKTNDEDDFDVYDF